MSRNISNAFAGQAIEDVLLAEKAASIIRQKIIEGKLAPGQKLTENELAQPLGISKICVREALKTLEHEGLINKVVNKYTEVVNLSLREIEEIFRLRAAIEVCCLEAAMENELLPIEKLDECSAIIDQRYNSAVKVESNQWVELDFSFHEMIVTSSQNVRATEAWMRLKNQAILALYYSGNEHNHKSGISHQDLVKAIKEEGFPAASEKLKRHILDAYYKERTRRNALLQNSISAP